MQPQETLTDAKLNDLQALRRFLAEQLADSDVSQDVCADLQLALTELVTNILVHGYPDRCGWIEVEVQQDEIRVQVVVRDRAPHFDPTQVPSPDTTLPLEMRPLGGLGIHLIRENVDGLVYRALEPLGNEIVLVKNRFSADSKS